jgi:hypothetical protein
VQQFPVNVGICVYCGRTDDLRDEHMVPLGLNGPWVLRKATCGACADITSRFEFDVLRNMLWPLRAKSGLRTRRKAERPASFPMQFGPKGNRQSEAVPIEEHPGSAIFPLFPVASHLSSGTGKEGIDVEGTVIIHLDATKMQAFAKKHRAANVSVTSTFKPAAFARLVAKVGYCYSAAAIGLAKFRRIYPLGTILGSSNDTGTWVGAGLEPTRNGAGNLHGIVLQEKDGEIVAFVRLFGSLNAPEYHVVVGQLS